MPFISFLPIILAVFGTMILQIIFSAFWFSPALFGKFWMKVTGMENKTREEIKQAGKEAMPYYFVQMFLTVISNLALLFLMFFLSPVIAVPLIWVGFLLPSVIQSEMWIPSSNIMKVKKVAVVSGQMLITLIMAAVIFRFFLF
jgi:hypothetical protein